MIKFLFFDLGNVLVRFSNKRLFQQVAACFGLTPDWVVNVLFHPDMIRQAECGQLTAEEYYRFACRESGNPESQCPDFETAMRTVNEIFWLNEPMQPTLARVAEQDFPRGVLSNIGPWHWDYCRKTFPILFERIPSNHVLSYRVGEMKPYQEIYAAAYETAQEAVPSILPEEVAFIDDLQANVVGANQFGFRAFLYSFDEHERLEIFLEENLPNSTQY